jgi:hypothetical protein
MWKRAPACQDQSVVAPAVCILSTLSGPLHKPPLDTRWRAGLRATLKVAQLRIAAKKFRGDIPRTLAALLDQFERIYAMYLAERDRLEKELGEVSK